jgi:hypothetical protein
MKKTLTLIILFSSLLFAFKLPDQAAEMPQWIKPGTKLIYNVEYNASQYEMTVSIKQVAPAFKFSFSISDPHNTKGNVNMSRDALDSCTKLMSTFASGQTDLMDQTALVMSKKLFNTAQQHDEMPPTEVDGYYVEMNKLKASPDFDLKIKGKQEPLKTLSLVSSADQPEFSNSLTVMNNASFPLILSMKAKWSFKLIEVK